MMTVTFFFNTSTHLFIYIKVTIACLIEENLCF